MSVDPEFLRRMGGPPGMVVMPSAEQREQQEAMMRKQEQLIVADRCIAVLTSETFAATANGAGAGASDARAVQIKAAHLLRIWFDGFKVVESE